MNSKNEKHFAKIQVCCTWSNSKTEKWEQKKMEETVKFCLKMVVEDKILLSLVHLT